MNHCYIQSEIITFFELPMFVLHKTCQIYKPNSENVEIWWPFLFTGRKVLTDDTGTHENCMTVTGNILYLLKIAMRFLALLWLEELYMIVSLFLICGAIRIRSLLNLCSSILIMCWSLSSVTVSFINAIDKPMILHTISNSNPNSFSFSLRSRLFLLTYVLSNHNLQ